MLQADRAATPEDEGRSFVFVSGLAGRGIRDQELDGPWWASLYTATQGADFGALFGVFGYGGNPSLARFYFKDVSGVVADDFLVLTALPEPDTATSLLAGLALLELLRRRRGR